MARLNIWLTGWLAAWGLEGLWLDLVSSFVLAASILLAAVLTGFAVERFDRFLVKAGGNGRAALFVVNRVMFIGTVFHELSHALFAFLTGAKVRKIRCLTLFSKDTLGYVEFVPTGGKAKRALQLALTSCAPVVTGFVTVPLFTRLAMYGVLPVGARLLAAYAALSILCHMSMSPMDLKLYGRGVVLALPLFTVLIYVLRFFLMPAGMG